MPGKSTVERKRIAVKGQGESLEREKGKGKREQDPKLTAPAEQDYRPKRD
jgi:hypothetical protein